MISVDWTLGLQMVNFLVLLFVLNNILYKPLQKVLKERSHTIESAKKTAKDLQADIDLKMQEYQKQLQEAKAVAAGERDALKKIATEQESDILADAHNKASDRISQIKEKVNEQASVASETLKANATGMANEIATKILGRELA